MDQEAHVQVVRRMYEIRFPKLPDQNLTISQIRGMEGIRVREAYRLASKQTGVRWTSRNYQTTDWDASDPVNRALSMGNAILYGVCHAAIVSLGYSPGLGFVHTGKMLSFVYDIADLYKADTTIPAAFEAVKEAPEDLGKAVRIRCRQHFVRAGVLKRIANDIAWIFDVPLSEEQQNAEAVGDLWSEDGDIDGGVNYAREDE
jgi:CRISPR-associated protein Cas1